MTEKTITIKQIEANKLNALKWWVKAQGWKEIVSKNAIKYWLTSFNKAENLELSYYSFEEEYKTSWDVFSKIRRVKKSQKIQKILTYSEIEYKDCNDFFLK